MNQFSPPPRRRRGLFIGRWLGIELILDYSWFLIAGIVTYTLATDFFPTLAPGHERSIYLAMGGAAAALFFLSILLHEFGHSVVSQRCGIPVTRITLLFIGGLAEISREPDDAKSELKIALGGPVVSIALAVVYETLTHLFRAVGWAPAATVAHWLATTNLALLVFNMIPGYPLDGGRVLRALLWAKSGKLRRATYITSRLGIGFSWCLAGLGLYLLMVLHAWNGFVFLLIAFFLKNAAEAGYTNALQREVLADKRVRDVMTPNPVALPNTLPLSLAVDEFFLTNHHVAFPVQTAEGELRGLLRLDALKEIPREKWPYVSTGDLVAQSGGEQLQISADVSAARAMRLLLAPGSGRLAVVDGSNKLVGIITRHDILHFIQIHTELEG